MYLEEKVRRKITLTEMTRKRYFLAMTRKINFDEKVRRKITITKVTRKTTMTKVREKITL
jgi:hypothetical protein